jgi:ribosomal protein S12 methylthiotransferase accessory factor
MDPFPQPASLNTLSQPLAGLLGGFTRFRAASDEPPLFTRIERLGDVGQVWTNVGRRKRAPHVRESVEGAGVGLSDADAAVRAKAEALERYCACVFGPEQFVRASANELGKAALDLSLVPRCSATELSNLRCPLLAPDKSAPIRWVKGISLFDGRQVYLPVVMVYLYAGMEGPGERIWFPISTGCAAQTTLEAALLAGLLEVVERDAISLTWLQQFSLPRLELDHLSGELASFWERYQRGCSELEYMFFDATTDIGIPTVYGLQLSPANRRVTTLVSCSTALDPAKAVMGAVREMAAGRIAFRQPRTAPENLEEFTEIFHGASYMARAEQAGAFDFLVYSGRRRLLSEMPSLTAPDHKAALRKVLDTLQEKQLEAFAVDLSTDEALRVGMRVVRVLIPRLQPLAFQYRARYLAHPRLYEAPKLMGYPVYPEEQLNRWPQPFA